MVSDNTTTALPWQHTSEKKKGDVGSLRFDVLAHFNLPLIHTNCMWSVSMCSLTCTLIPNLVGWAQVDTSVGLAGSTSPMSKTTQHSWAHLILCNPAPPPQASFTTAPLLLLHLSSAPLAICRNRCIARQECSSIDTACGGICGGLGLGKNWNI